MASGRPSSSSRLGLAVALAFAAVVARSAAAAILPGPVPLPPQRPSAAVPLPPPRPGPAAEPRVFGPPMPRPAFGPPAPPAAAPMKPVMGPPAPGPNPATASPPAADPACARLFAGREVEAEPAAPVTGAGGCGIAAPVRLKAVLLGNGRRVAVEPPALIRCDLAQAIADWVRDDLTAAFAGGPDLLALAGTGSYECRGRDRLPDAPLSEHGKGNAIDIGAFRFTGSQLPVRQIPPGAPWPAVKAAACARFATVLGPGSDLFHADHLHLDLRARRNNSHFCQWNLP